MAQNIGTHATRQTTSGPPNVVVEVLDTAVGMAGKVKDANDYVVKVVAGSEAFRKYNWLAGVPVLNSAGNLRGMVVNPRMRAIYTMSVNFGEKLAKADQALGLASIFIEIAKDYPRLQQAFDSDAPLNDKGPLMLSLASMAILRAVTGVVPAGAHLLAKSLEGYCDLAFVLTGGSNTAPLTWAEGLQSLDSQITAAHRQIFDGQNYYNFIMHHLVI